jgi:hypothetical protein
MAKVELTAGARHFIKSAGALRAYLWLVKMVVCPSVAVVRSWRLAPMIKSDAEAGAGARDCCHAHVIQILWWIGLPGGRVDR